MRSIRKSLAVLLCAVMLIPLFGMTSSAQSYGGQCGDNVYWSLDTETCTLTFSGSGKMYDYHISMQAPWCIYKQYIEHIVIEPGVTSIGKWAFCTYENLVSVSIPDTVTLIDSNAFYECHSLESFIVPESVTEFNSGSFINYDVYNEYEGGLYIGSKTNPYFIYFGPKERGKAYNSSWLPNVKEIKLNENTKIIASGALYCCSSIESIVFPDSVEYIGSGLCYECPKLKSIYFGKGVKYIDTESQSFFIYNVPSVESLEVAEDNPYYYTEGNCVIEKERERLVLACNTSFIPYDSTIKGIGKGAFDAAHNVKELFLPKTLEYLPDDLLSHEIFFECYRGTYAADKLYHKGYVSYLYDNPFTDVRNSWYYKAVMWCNYFGLMIGTGETTFAPDGALTRAMFVQVLARLSGDDLDSVDAVLKFTDVEKGKWYYNAVMWAWQNGVTAGISETEFAPDSPVSREQIVTFLFAYAKNRGFDMSSSAPLDGFDDADSVSRWAIIPMKWAVAEGLISGRQNGDSTSLAPKATSKRSEGALIFRNFAAGFSDYYKTQVEGEVCIITFDAAGGKCDAVRRYVNKGSKLSSLPAPEREGFTFVCWKSYEIHDGKPLSYGNAVDNDTEYYWDQMILVAQWE